MSRSPTALGITLALGAGFASPVMAQLAEQQARFEQLSALYADAGLLSPPELVECTLSGGAETYCISLTTGPAPANHSTGPYCPRSIDTEAENSGTWFLNDEVVAADGSFIERLAVIFQDDEWQMFDPETGKVILVEGELGCEVAGDPNSAEDYKNYCVECEVKYLSADTSETYVIPLIPVASEGEPAFIGPAPGVGLAFNGVKLDAPAPLELIEGNHTLGLMDGCVGHVNPYTGYHYHGLTGCEPHVHSAAEGHEPQVAVAMDGYDIYAALSAESTATLDACNGHDADGLGYHYHSDPAGTNQFIGCFTAQYGCALSDPDGQCDASATQGRGGPPPQGPRP
ncbi:YHYH protein [Alphaproteobacteria bacterium KMM 3653]|uniref:YHYH protein n=1 Tax=Harenicola maris TaxID=2841044 RepID=A0AAP2CQQ5_9RHOB|nr:YHYH protein [Harenicola maris]